MSKFLSYFVSIAIAGLVAFGTSGQPVLTGTLDWLIFVAVWFLIIIGGIGAVLIWFAWSLMEFFPQHVTKRTRTEALDKINTAVWWASIPLSLLWLAAFVHVGWTVTAVVYFIETVAGISGTFVLRSSVIQLLSTESPGLENFFGQHVKDPAVRRRVQEVLDSKE